MEYKFGYKLGAVYLFKSSRPKFYKIIEHQRVNYSIINAGGTKLSGRITRIKGDSIYFDGIGYRFHELKSISIRPGMEYRHSDSLYWKVYFPPDSSYKSPFAQSRYVHTVLDTFQRVRTKSWGVEIMHVFYHNNIRFNIIDPFVLRAAISYEYRFNPRFSWEAEAGYRFQVQGSAPGALEWFQWGSYRGPSLITGPKFCFKPGRFYIGTMIHSDYLEMHNFQSTFYHEHYHQLQDEYRYDLGLSLRAGFFTRVGKGTMDMHAGVGYKYGVIHELRYGRWSEEDSNWIIYYHADHSPDILNFTVWQPIIDFGISIGFGF